jgi:hypothetical protein
MAALTRELVESAFDAIGSEAARRGLVVEMAVYGGSCIMLASDLRNATGDVDAVFLTDAAILYEIADLVAVRLGLPPDWLNQAVKRMAPPPGGAMPRLIRFGDYPRAGEAAVGLRVFLPTPAYVLAMKLLANRGEAEAEKTQSDMADIVGLMRITGLCSLDDLFALLRECYPHLPGIHPPALNARLQAKIRSVLDVFSTTSDDAQPTWNAGRGPPTRQS